MALPDTNDGTLALWRKILANAGGTDDANAGKRATLSALTALSAS